VGPRNCIAGEAQVVCRFLRGGVYVLRAGLLVALSCALGLPSCFGYLPSVENVLESFKKRYSEVETVRAVYLDDHHWYKENARRMFEEHFLIKGKWLWRQETYDAETGKLESIRRYNDKTWVMYEPQERWAQIEQHKLSERCWHDLEMGQCLWEILKDAAVSVHAHPVGANLAIVEADAPQPADLALGKVIATVSPSEDFRLYELQLFSREGFRFRRTEYKDYAKVEGDIWYPTEVITERYGTDKNGQPYVHTRIKWVLKTIEVNKPIKDEEIEVELPEGTVINDKTIGEEFIYRKGEPLDERLAMMMDLPGYRGGKFFLPLKSLGKSGDEKETVQPPSENQQKKIRPAMATQAAAAAKKDEAEHHPTLFLVLVGLTILLIVYRIVRRREFQRPSRRG
jgi:hypothetical protein